MALPDAVLHLDGGLAVPTALATGPWSRNAQHGGAVAALLAHVLERLDPGDATFPARLSVELLHPAPLTPLRVHAATTRPGRRVQLLEASLLSEGHEVARATLLRLREHPLEYEPNPANGAVVTLPPPTTAGPLQGSLAGRLGFVGFWDAVETSAARGSFEVPGPAAMWLRLTVPVVAGEATSPLQRVAATADFGNGLGAALPARRYTFINPDLSIALHRLPEGEWIGLDAATYAEPNGIGLVETVLHDVRGRVGRAEQTLLIDERDEPLAES